MCFINILYGYVVDDIHESHIYYMILDYQLDFVTPGKRHSLAISLRTCRDNPKFL